MPESELELADAAAPATKGDVFRLERKLTGRMDDMKQEILDHFDVAVENIAEELKGANADEVSSLKDADNRLHERVVPLEQRAGLASSEQPHPLR